MNLQAICTQTDLFDISHPARFFDDDNYTSYDCKFYDSDNQYEGGDDLEQHSFEVDEQKSLIRNHEDVYEPKTLDELVPYSDFVNEKQSGFKNFIGRIDYMDKRLSRTIALRQDCFNNAFFGFWGWICNREKVVLQIPLIWLLTYLWPSKIVNKFSLSETTLKSHGFVTDGNAQITDDQPFWVYWRLAFIIWAFVTVTLGGLVILLVVILKKLCARQRPSNLLFLKRHLDMRSREPGKAMPSGDTFAAAYFCIFYIYYF